MFSKLMLPFRNAHCMLRKHLVQLGCFLSLILIAECAKELTANISRFLLMEVTDMNWETGIKGQIMAVWSLKHIVAYRSRVLLLPPSRSFPHTLLELQWGEGFPLRKHQWSFSFADRKFLGRQTAMFPHALKAWLSLLHFSPGDIWPVLYWGDAERDLAAVDLTEINVHIADFKKTTLHQINVMLSILLGKNKD